MTRAFAVIDVDHWPPAGEEQLGTKPKQWLAHPETGDLWLWKESTWNTGRDGRRYRKGDDWAERIACEVGRALDLPVARVELAAPGELPGVISRRFLTVPQVLVHGNELLPISDPTDRTGYTADAVARVLAGVEPPRSHPSLSTAMDWFVGYLLLDALVGNTDRHIENWGVVRTGSVARLAPSFDHASCLGFLLSDVERDERLNARDENRTVRAYAARARTKFHGRPHPVTAVQSALPHATASARRHWTDAALVLTSIDDLLGTVPDSRMSGLARDFAAELYQENFACLSQAVRKLSS
jgi:hypothetical protein